MLKKLQNRQGFTLIELLIVVVILGVLILIVIGATRGDKGKANDAKRKADLTRIQNALEDCYSGGAYGASIADSSTFATCVKSKFDSNTVPTDPVGSVAYTYTPAADGSSYTIATTGMEKEGQMTLNSKQ